MTQKPTGMSEAPREYKLEENALQIKKIGNSLGLILSKDILSRLKLKEGDKLLALGFRGPPACRRLSGAGLVRVGGGRGKLAS